MEATSNDTMTAAVFAGGTMDHTVEVSDATLVVAADSGYDIARSRDLTVDVLVGDMDSISDEGLAEAEALGIDIHRYPTDKDATDLELAIETALAMGATAITVYGGEGGRFDHLLGVALGLTAPRWEGVPLVWKIRGAHVHRVLPTDPLDADVLVGAIVTVLPVGPVTRATSTGLQWGLDDEDLERGTTHGLSNIAIEPTITISLAEGALLVIIEESDPE